ncbi:DUF2075 domain-containing protein [Mesoterricola silvestris]|uniref:ATPase AAA n=1 Tax=Mesoterricola silvestris TaxID=2927979 RepID=A0AA48KD58_9BACT|nr:DUF2075 domain-containing protein [Mesoterricola silvestris]BDU74168.1 ATPase AAA [Mesoterricola silvestris]
MIVFKSSVAEFLDAVERSALTGMIETRYRTALHRAPAPGERQAWQNSMNFVCHRLRRSKIPQDCGVLIEYVIPTTLKRMDLVLSGFNREKNKQVLIIELKQWMEARLSRNPDLVWTRMGGGDVETPHPCYQAYSYLRFLQDLHEGFGRNEIRGRSCAYLHNYEPAARDEPLLDKRYRSLQTDAPLFLGTDHEKLEGFLADHFHAGDGGAILDQLETGPFRPSKRLMDEVANLYEGNPSFLMLDEQKVAYENIVAAVLEKGTKKRTIIVQGGPGTGKSVISMNAFGHLLRSGLNVRFVAPNAAFRQVTKTSLVRKGKRGVKATIDNLFLGSASFLRCNENTFDALIVDEAHRLKGKGAYQYFGESQVEDILKASRLNVFFVDDNQRIRKDDIGTVDTIRKAAAKFQSKVTEFNLVSQFRCSGADGFLQWLDDVLGIQPTANFDGWDPDAFTFEICPTPGDVLARVQAKNREGKRARMLAGYAWKWSSEGNGNGEVEDVRIPEHGFAMPWNGRTISTSWAIHPDGEGQIGCVHTSQGLEFDYVGVLVGRDLQYDPDRGDLRASWSDYKDSTGKKGLKEDPATLTRFVGNIYKILMSRGMKGCFVYIQDEALAGYFQDRLGRTPMAPGAMGHEDSLLATNVGSSQNRPGTI